MSVNNRIGRASRREGMKPWRIVVYSLCFAVLIFTCAVLQTTCLSFLGKAPALTFALVCAIGFIMGDKAGAIWGILGGIAADIIGGAGFSFSPVVYMLCGYCCGAFVGWFLSKNLPSFIAYALISGVFKEIFTFAYFGLFSKEFSPVGILLKVVLPEYLAYILCILPAYFAVLAIFSLFKGKDNGERQG